jgi:RimJ/RimL family protein N-acetyltransferase
MELNHKLFFNIEPALAELKCLEPSDVTNAYVDGLKKQKKYLIRNPENITLKKQQDYVSKIAISSNDIILGLFINSILIGTAGIQNLLTGEKPTIGIFIFSESQRQRGLGKALLWSGSYLLNKSIGIMHIYANIAKTNVPSLKLFLSSGYKITEENKSEYWVGLHINDLLKPSTIKNCKLLNQVLDRR